MHYNMHTVHTIKIVYWHGIPIAKFSKLHIEHQSTLSGICIAQCNVLHLPFPPEIFFKAILTLHLTTVYFTMTYILKCDFISHNVILFPILISHLLFNLFLWGFDILKISIFTYLIGVPVISFNKIEFLLFETSLHNTLVTWFSCRLNLGGEHPLDQAVPVWFSNSIYSAVPDLLIWHTIFPQHCVVRLELHFVPRKLSRCCFPSVIQYNSRQLYIKQQSKRAKQRSIDTWYETTINSLLESSSVAEKGTSPKG